MNAERVLISGVTGMVGSHLADYLLSNTKYIVHGIARWRSPLENLVDAFDTNACLGVDRFYLNYGDLIDPNSINKIVQEVRPTKVFHLGAQSFPTASFQMPSMTFDANVTGTSNILEAVRLYCPTAKVLVCSSSEIFGKVPRNLIPIREDCPVHPASPYAISKVGTDLIGRFYGEAYNIQTVVTRMFTHTGPRRGDYFAEATFAKQIALIENGLQTPTIKVGNLKSLRTVADVRDAVRAYSMLIESSYSPGDTFNIGGDTVVTVEEILTHLISLSTHKNICIEVEESRLRPIDADLQVPCTDKFRTHCGWEPQYSFEDTMGDLLEYWRERISSGIFPRISR